MKNIDRWQPTKFIQGKNGAWMANKAFVSPFSLIMSDMLATAYANVVNTYVNGKLADIGCGNVPLYGMYKEHTSDITCFDWPHCIHDMAYVDYYHDLNVEIEGWDDTFDCVIATDVLEHLHTPSSLFSSASRILKKGGHLIIGVPFMYWIHEAPHDYYRYTRFALERLVYQSNLNLIQLDNIGGGPSVIADLMLKNLIGHPKLGLIFFKLFNSMLRIGFIKDRDMKSKNIFPLAYILVAQKS